MRSDNSKAAKSSMSSPSTVLPTQSVTMCSDTVPSPRIALGCPPSRADCVSFTKELIEELFLRTETSYLRASSCSTRSEMYEKCTLWKPMSANGEKMDVEDSHNR